MPQVVASAGDTQAGGQLSELRLDQLRPGRYQPRTRMDEGSLFELAESIRSQGVMQPILVRPIQDAEGLPAYEIIAGERRSRAARIAGLDKVPVLIREVPDQAAAVMALIENLQREDLNPLEEAQGVQRLISEFNLTHDAAAQAIGRSRSATTNLLRLLNLAPPVQQMLVAGDLDMGHARALLALERRDQLVCANEIVARQLSVREAEKLVSRTVSADSDAPRARKSEVKSRDLMRLQEQLSDQLMAEVDIRIRDRGHGRQSGEIAIVFSSIDELNGVLERLGLGSD